MRRINDKERKASDDSEMADDESIEVPFSLAMIAGGLAGTTVDVAMYPLDCNSLRTCIQ